MSAHLDQYLTLLDKSRKLNPEAEKVAEQLKIGARRGGMGARREQRFPLRRRGAQRGVGQNSSAPYESYDDCVGVTSVPVGAPVAGPCPPEFLCDCDLIGVTTLGTDPIGDAGTREITVTDFDAVALQAVAVWFTAFVACPDEDGDPQTQIANPVIEVPVLIDDVEVGQNGQLRVSGLANGLNSAGFAATREPVCLDWAPFRSQNGQELTFEVVNIVCGIDLHFFALLWTNVLQ